MKLGTVFGRFWSTDRSLTVLLLLLGIVLFIVYPLVDLGLVGRLLMTLCFSLMLVSGAAAVAKSLVSAVLVGGLVVANLAVRWLSFWRDGPDLAVWNAVMPLVFCGVLASVVLVQVFREGPITPQRIQGAVAVYLLLGLAWAFAYKLIGIERPDAFIFPTGLGRPSSKDQTLRFVYFSFVTLTTIGYGDMTAVHPVARALVMLEGLTGQLFPAILLARLVSMELYYRQRRDAG